MKNPITLLFLAALLSGCCSGSGESCEEGVTVRVRHNPQSEVKEMTLKWKAGDSTGEETFNIKDDRFLIEEGSDVLGESVVIALVLGAAVISEETYEINWRRAACGDADGPRWCADSTYEWAEIEIDLREEEDLD